MRHAEATPRHLHTLLPPAFKAAAAGSRHPIRDGVCVPLSLHLTWTPPSATWRPWGARRWGQAQGPPAARCCGQCQRPAYLDGRLVPHNQDADGERRDGWAREWTATGSETSARLATNVEREYYMRDGNPAQRPRANTSGSLPSRLAGEAPSQHAVRRTNLADCGFSSELCH